MTDDIRAELTLQRDYLRHALEIVTPLYDHLKIVSVTSNDDKIMLLSELARLQGYLSGGLEMIEHRLGDGRSGGYQNRFNIDPIFTVCSPPAT